MPTRISSSNHDLLVTTQEVPIVAKALKKNRRRRQFLRFLYFPFRGLLRKRRSIAYTYHIEMMSPALSQHLALPSPRTLELYASSPRGRATQKLQSAPPQQTGVMMRLPQNRT